MTGAHLSLVFAVATLVMHTITAIVTSGERLGWVCAALMSMCWAIAETQRINNL